MSKNNHEIATLAGGCFWCTEAVFQRLKGVEKVVSGYSGGTIDDPTYEQVSSGASRHAESVQITYDPKIISFEQILDVFWKLHDPTTLNRQGADVGTQYRSAIFYHDEKQKETAQRSKEKLDESGLYPHPAVTEISPFVGFFPAEEYHKDFYNRNKTQGYCRLVIDPKIQKLYKEFGSQVKKS